MIDNFSLGLTHALLLLVAWRMVRRPDLDHENGEQVQPWGRRRDA